MQNSKIKDALEASDRFMDDLEERLAYVNREMAMMDYKSDAKDITGMELLREKAILS